MFDTFVLGRWRFAAPTKCLKHRMMFLSFVSTALFFYVDLLHEDRGPQVGRRHGRGRGRPAGGEGEAQQGPPPPLVPSQGVGPRAAPPHEWPTTVLECKNKTYKNH